MKPHHLLILLFPLLILAVAQTEEGCPGDTLDETQSDSGYDQPIEISGDAIDFEFTIGTDDPNVPIGTFVISNDTNEPVTVTAVLSGDGSQNLVVDPDPLVVQPGEMANLNVHFDSSLWEAADGTTVAASIEINATNGTDTATWFAAINGSILL